MMPTVKIIFILDCEDCAAQKETKCHDMIETDGLTLLPINILTEADILSLAFRHIII